MHNMNVNSLSHLLHSSPQFLQYCKTIHLNTIEFSELREVKFGKVFKLQTVAKCIKISWDLFIKTMILLRFSNLNKRIPRIENLFVWGVKRRKWIFLKEVRKLIFSCSRKEKEENFQGYKLKSKGISKETN